MNPNQPRRLCGPCASKESGLGSSLSTFDPYGHISCPSPSPSLGSLMFGGHGENSNNGRANGVSVHNYFTGRGDAMANNFVFQHPGNYNLNLHHPPVMQAPTAFNPQIRNQNGIRLAAPMPTIPTAIGPCPPFQPRRIGIPDIAQTWPMDQSRSMSTMARMAPMNQPVPRRHNGLCNSPQAFPQRVDAIPSVDQVDLTRLNLGESSSSSYSSNNMSLVSQSPSQHPSNFSSPDILYGVVPNGSSWNRPNATNMMTSPPPNARRSN